MEVISARSVDLTLSPLSHQWPVRKKKKSPRVLSHPRCGAYATARKGPVKMGGGEGGEGVTPDDLVLGSRKRQRTAVGVLKSGGMGRLSQDLAKSFERRKDERSNL